MIAHGIAVHLGVFLNGKDESKYLELTPVEVDELVKALSLALRSPDLNVSVFGIRTSTREVLCELDLSITLDSNMALLLKSDVYDSIPIMLRVDDEDTLEAAISLVWTIATSRHHEIAMDMPVQQKLSVAIPILKELSNNKTSVSKMAEYAFLSLQPDLLSGMYILYDTYEVKLIKYRGQKSIWGNNTKF